MPDYKATANMLRLIRLLEDTYHGALRVNQVAETLGVHRRTVVRWVQALEADLVDDDGNPILRREHRGNDAWIVLTGAQTVLTANIFQYAAAYAALQHLDVGGGSLLTESAQDIVDRVEKGLPHPLRAVVPRILQSFHYVPFASKDHRAIEDTLDVVVRALIRRHAIGVDYTNASGQSTTTEIMPWSLVMYRDGFYVLAKLEGSDTLRLYAVERMANASINKAVTFEVPESFDPADEFAANLGLWRTQGAPTDKVVIAFQPDAESVVRARQWPGIQSLETGADGRLYLTLHVPVTPEIKTWVLGWGPMAEVLEPPTLRELVADQIRASIQQYDDS